jgi:DNA-binding transcriptional MerR regulator
VGGAPAGDDWKIDELAQRSGVSVDSIRFYGREGLLPPVRRSGRSILYGQAHLDRLNQIRDLQQGRHFTLAGIKQLVDRNRLDLLDRMLGEAHITLNFSELVEQSGLPQDLVDELVAIGVLCQPEQRGGIAFDEADLSVLRALGQLLDAGMPKGVILVVARLHLKHLWALSEEILAIFGTDNPDLGGDVPADQLRTFYSLASNDVGIFQSQIDVLMEYLHRRTLEQLVVIAVEDDGLQLGM